MLIFVVDAFMLWACVSALPHAGGCYESFVQEDDWGAVTVSYSHIRLIKCSVLGR